MPAMDRDEALRELGRASRERREDAQVSLEDIFERTRIRVEYLRGIEQGNYQGFPDVVYVKGFVRTYLALVGAEDLKGDFSMWLDKDAGRKTRNLPPENILGNGTLPTKGFKPASRFWLFSVLFLMLLGAGGYVWHSWTYDLLTPLRGGGPDEPFPARVVSEEVSQDRLPFIISPDQPFITAPPVVSAAPKPEPPKPYLHIKARSDVWIKTTIGDKVVYSQTLKSGKEVSWDLPARAKVTYGRPNMADVVLNGKELGPPNPQGSKKSETYLYSPDGTHQQVQ